MAIQQPVMIDQPAVAAPARSQPGSAAAVRPSLLLSIFTLWLREIRSFYRQRSRLIAGLATPLVFWLLLGSGFGTSLRTSTGGEGGYLQFFFPGSIALVVLFTAMFSNISIIEDRREGFILSVLVAPVSRWALVVGKILGATTIGVMQGLVFLPLAPLAGMSIDLSRIPMLLAMLVALAVGLTGLGFFFFAWWLNSVQGFHSVMNIVLMPMWLLSGAIFPAEGAAAWVRWVMVINPLSYGLTVAAALSCPGRGGGCRTVPRRLLGGDVGVRGGDAGCRLLPDQSPIARQLELRRWNIRWPRVADRK